MCIDLSTLATVFVCAVCCVLACLLFVAIVTVVARIIIALGVFVFNFSFRNVDGFFLQTYLISSRVTSLRRCARVHRTQMNFFAGSGQFLQTFRLQKSLESIGLKHLSNFPTFSQFDRRFSFESKFDSGYFTTGTRSSVFLEHSSVFSRKLSLSLRRDAIAMRFT